ncbi:hypothetical protein DL96DRAFT_1284010 [Flagelloscypha sp. PMI_526]|nr:hypothetical protein DL96DRAFT_1284010 [Flagelloscypha sp. PMI_526]
MTRRLNNRDIFIALFAVGITYLFNVYYLFHIHHHLGSLASQNTAPIDKSGDSTPSILHVEYEHTPQILIRDDNVPMYPIEWVQPPPRARHDSPNQDILLPTELRHHAPGWTLFSNIYMADDTFYIVLPSDEEVSQAQQKFPEMRLMISRPLFALNEPQNIADREPVDGRTMKFISIEVAERLWGIKGERILVVEGNTVLVHEPGQFLQHFYHTFVELWFGVWIFWTGAHSNGGSEDVVTPPIHRLIFARTPSWHDPAGLNVYLFRGLFPSMSIENEEDWNERVGITAGARRVFRFPTLLLTDRSASHRGHWTGTQNQRIASEAWEYVKEKNLIPTSSLKEGQWWRPVREAVWRYAGVQSFHTWTKDKPITISYWSRQLSRSRKLRPQDHLRLVEELDALAKRKGWHFNHVDAEKISKDKQIQLISSTDILLGIHGNGLSHLTFMPHSNISTVIELFYPTGFAHDYQWTSFALGHGYAAVWNDTHHSHHPKMWPNYPNGQNGDGGFQGNHIPVHAPYVAQLIEGRVEGAVDLMTGVKNH